MGILYKVYIHSSEGPRKSCQFVITVTYTLHFLTFVFAFAWRDRGKATNTRRFEKPSKQRRDQVRELFVHVKYHTMTRLHEI